MPTTTTEAERQARDEELRRRVFEFCDAASARGERLTSDIVRRAIGGNSNKVHDYYREWKDARRQRESSPGGQAEAAADTPNADLVVTTFHRLVAAVTQACTEAERELTSACAAERQRLANNFERNLLDATRDAERARRDAEDERANADGKAVALEGAKERIEALESEIADLRLDADRRIEEIRRAAHTEVSNFKAANDSEIATLRERLAGADATNLALREQLAAINVRADEITDLRAQLARTEATVMALREQLHDAQTRAEAGTDLKAKLGRSEADCDAARREAEAASARLSVLEDRLLQLTLPRASLSAKRVKSASPKNPLTPGKR